MPPQNTVYGFHVANLREVDKGLARVGRELRRALAEGDDPTASALTKLYALGLAVKIECRLSKLLYEPNVTDADRRAVMAVDQQVERWHSAIELGLRKHYAGPTASLDDLSLGHDVHARYKTLRSAVEDDLRPLIELRNKLAHGQWVYPLTESNDVAASQKAALASENALTLTVKNRLLDSLADVVHDLVVSKRAFEGAFERRYRSLALARQELQVRRFSKFRSKLQASRRRGRRHLRRS